MGRVTTGDATPYTDSDIDDLVDALESAFDDWDGDGVPTRLYVHQTDIEWSGSRNSQPVRSTRLDGLVLGPVRAAVEQVRAAEDRVRAAGAGVQRADRRNRAGSWHSQIVELTRTAAGRSAADAAGLAPTRRTLVEWLAAEHEPNRANQNRIADAYGALRDERIGRARSAVGAARSVAAGARRAAVDALTVALRDRYGAEIRLRQPTLILEP